MQEALRKKVGKIKNDTEHATYNLSETKSEMLKDAKKAGISEDITNHSLRHSYVSCICDNYGINVAKDVIGHSSTRITEKYAHNTKDTIKNAMVSVF